MRVVAFDIDGTLTTLDGFKLYEELRSRDMVVGVVTSREESEASLFIRDMGIDPDFVRTGFAKSLALRGLEREYPDAGEYIYYGNRPRDRVAATLSGWNYSEP